MTVNLLEHTPARRYNVKGQKVLRPHPDMATTNDTNAIGATSVQWAIEEEVLRGDPVPGWILHREIFPVGTIKRGSPGAAGAIGADFNPGFPLPHR